MADSAPAAGTPATVTADALPTVQINGVAWAQVTVGNTVYVTGSFSQARPAGAAAGTNQTARSNLLAYDIRTGNLITSFNHPLNGQGLTIAASPDGSRVYVGGEFTTVDGVARNRIAAFNTATGAQVSGFAPSFNSTVRALTASNATVYAGGSFTTVAGSTRSRLAAVTAAGALTTWAPVANDAVTAIVLSGDGSRVIPGGRFTTLNGAARVGIGAVSASTGTTVSWNTSFPIQNSGSGSDFTQLVSDGTNIYGTAYQFQQGGNFEGRFAADPYTGNIVWLNSCHGDSYGLTVIGQVVYSAGHAHDCSDAEDYNQDDNNVFSSRHNYVMAESVAVTGTQRNVVIAGGPGLMGPTYSNFGGQPHSAQLNWYPSMTAGTYTGQTQAAWSVSGNSTYLSVGGEFPTVNGSAQQGLTRFAISGSGPNARGPLTSATLTPTGVGLASGSIRVAWRTTSDQDNETLTYRLFRDGGSTAISTTTVNSRYWYLPTAGFTDTGLVAGSAHTYRVTATDPFGNVRTSSTSASIAAGTAGLGTYANRVRSDGASNFWPLSESSGTVARDQAGANDLTLGAGVTRGTAGPAAAGSGTAATFPGTVTTTTTGTPPFIMTTSNSTSFGVSTGNGVRLSRLSVEAWVKTTSTSGGTVVSYGMSNDQPSLNADRTLYLAPDGRVYFGIWAANTNNTVNSTAAVNDGTWHHLVGTVGADGQKLYVDGAQVAVRAGVTNSPSLIAGYWRVGGDGLPYWAQAPSTLNTWYNLVGSIADVAVYPAALSATQVAAHYGTAAPPANQSPAAAFTPACTALACSFNAGASSDPDGAIASYAWNFGDGTTANAVTASHTYAAAGTYPVTLTVTDNQGATATTSHTVQVTAAAQTVFANDTFNRTAASGWGTADTGGAWSTAGSAANWSVTPGAGSIRLTTAGAGPGTVSLAGVSQRDVDASTVVSANKLTEGSTTGLDVVARRTSNTSRYVAHVRFRSTGVIALAIGKNDGSSTETPLASEVALSGVTYTPGTKIRVRFQTIGASPATVRAKAWVDGTAEPTTWTVTGTDTSPGTALQSGGSAGLSGYLSSKATNAPLTFTVSLFAAVQPA